MHCSARKSSGHFDPLILGWVSATQPTSPYQSSAQNEHMKSSYLFDNLKIRDWWWSMRPPPESSGLFDHLKMKIGWTRNVQPTKGYGAGLCDPHHDQVANFAT